MEHSFGILKGKFRKLKYLDMCMINVIPTVITAPDNYDFHIDDNEDQNVDNVNMYDINLHM